MGMTIGRRRFLVAGAIIAASGTSFAALAQAVPEAGQFIESLADKAVSALTEKSTPRAERIRRFRILFKENFAVETIARWVLGQAWRRATESERAEYLNLFEDLIVFNYVDRFTEYAGERLTVIKTLKVENGDTMVYSAIVRPNMPEPLAVDWRVRTRDGQHKIVDVMVERLSMGVTQGQEFSSVLNRNNGSVAGFLNELRERVRKGA